jgi:hypothetical protein
MSGRTKAALVALLVIVFGALGVNIVVDENESPPPTTTTITVDKSAKPGMQEQELTVPKTAEAIAGKAPELQEDLKDETPEGVPNEVIEGAREKADELAASDQLPIVTPDAAPVQRGCESHFVRNYSSRRGVAPRWIVIHETVSPNLPGVRDLLGLTARANDPRSMVSWTYNIDRDGNCFYVVRESDKSWTQAVANPFSIGIEVVNTTREQPFMKPVGYRKLGLVISDAAKRWNIPLVLGSAKGCAPGQAGIISHAMLGSCGGGHVDINAHDCSASYDECQKARLALHPGLRTILGYARRARESQRPKLTKQAKWSLRHAALHKQYKVQCRTKRQRSGTACKQLRSRNRAYHRLLHRGS